MPMRAPLRMVVNCAGLGWASRILSKKGVHDYDLFKTVVGVNLIGTFNVMRLAAEAIAQTEPVDESGQRGSRQGSHPRQGSRRIPATQVSPQSNVLDSGPHVSDSLINSFLSGKNKLRLGSFPQPASRRDEARRAVEEEERACRSPLLMLIQVVGDLTL